MFPLKRKRVLSTLLCVALLQTACEAAPPTATSLFPATATPIARQNIVPVPKTTIELTLPTATQPPTPIPASATQPPTPEPTDMAAKTTTVPLETRIVAQPVFTSTPTSGFTQTIVISMIVSTGISNGVNLTTVVPYTVSNVPPPVSPVVLPEGTLNIALLGADTRPQQGGLNTDVIIVASIHPTLPVVTMLSIPRDTLVFVPGAGMRKVNTAFRFGGEKFGAEVFRQTLLYNFGINVDYYAMVNFRGVVNAVNALDGIDVVATCPLFQTFPKDPYYLATEGSTLTVTVPYTDTFTGEVWQPGTLVPTTTINISHAGRFHLNGQQALAFARARYGVPGGDVDRGRRTQQIIRATLSKLRHIGSITKIPELYSQFKENFKTDLTLDQIVNLARQSDRLDSVTFRSRYFDGVGMTAATLPVAGAVLIPNRDNIHSYVQQALSVPDNIRANEGVPVEFWNGTSYDGFDAAASDRLRELGFVVVQSRAVDLVTTTQVIDFSTTKKGSATPLLQRSFNLKPSQILSQPGEQPNGARYRIVAGKDFDPCYFSGYSFPRTTSGTTQPTTTTVTNTVTIVATTVVELPILPTLPPQPAPPTPAP
jgi:LCP family protein required for cell wall assembly